MAVIPYNQNPKITDTIEFLFQTPDSDGCFLDMPYKIDNVKIFFVERDFISGNTSVYEDIVYDTQKLVQAELAEAEACARSIIKITATNPTVITSLNHKLVDGNVIKITGSNSTPSIDGEYAVSYISQNEFSIQYDLSTGSSGNDGKFISEQKIERARALRQNADSTIKASKFHFKDAKLVQTIGDSDFPAWLAGADITSITQTNPAVITSDLAIPPEVANGDTIYIYNSNCIPPIDGEHKITILGSNTFSIPVDLSNLASTTAGTKGMWLTAKNNSDNFLLPVVENDKVKKGHFKYYWEPKLVREGDYFVCWTWTPEPAGTQISSHLRFYLNANTEVSTSNPSHKTDPKKYPTLLDIYTPEMYKMYISNDDVTPDVIQKFNQSVALGFATVEDLANQLLDLQDPNVLNEALLPYLSNLFNLKLKSNDPTRWRSQIVRAIPQFKAKGTIGALAEAFQLAGMKFHGIKQLWQVFSKYTWQESFVFDGTNYDFILEKNIYNSANPGEFEANFELYVRKSNLISSISSDGHIRVDVICENNHGLQDGDVIHIRQSNTVPSIDGKYLVDITSPNSFEIKFDLSEGNNGTFGVWYKAAPEYETFIPDPTSTYVYSDYVSFASVDGKTVMTWDPTVYDLKVGDIVRVVYPIAEVPDVTEQSLETYLRTLPIIDKRDELEQTYPRINWNVRGIEESDLLFNLLIPSRHPFQEFLIFGKVRTEFPYSENIYNMEEYNGSIRNSRLPCDIDKNFKDPCFSCISSSYNISVEVDEISNDRIQEFYEILSEFTPFHAVLHTANITAGVQEFISPPVEIIEKYVTKKVYEFVIAGEGQQYFNRTMKLSNLNNLLTSQCIFRGYIDPSDPLNGKPYLADSELVETGLTGVLYNTDLLVYCPSTTLKNLAIRQDSGAFIKILNTSYAGDYPIESLGENYLIVDNTSLPTEPVDECNLILDSDGNLSTCQFSFRIFDPVIDGDGLYFDRPFATCDVERADYVTLNDASIDFSSLNIETEFDVANNGAGTAWTIEIGSVSHNILNINPDGKLLIEFKSGLIALYNTNVSYDLYNGATLVQSGSGMLAGVPRGLVTVDPTSYLLPISSMFVYPLNYYMNISSVEYPIIQIVQTSNSQFYIGDYTGAGLAGINLNVNRRVLDNQLGYFSHRGIKLELSGDYQTILGIQNGSNPPPGDPIMNNNFMENFIIEIDGDTYWMTDIKYNEPDHTGKTTITLSGPDYYYKTFEAGGTVTTTVNIYKYTIKGATIEGQVYNQETHTFETLDRSGSPIISNTQEPIAAMKSLGDDAFYESIKQSEGIAFKIEYKNGRIEKGELNGNQ